jgi:hypothetical protein
VSPGTLESQQQPEPHTVIAAAPNPLGTMWRID